MFVGGDRRELSRQRACRGFPFCAVVALASSHFIYLLEMMAWIQDLTISAYLSVSPGTTKNYHSQTCPPVSISFPFALPSFAFCKSLAGASCSSSDFFVSGGSSSNDVFFRRWTDGIAKRARILGAETGCLSIVYILPCPVSTVLHLCHCSCSLQQQQQQQQE